MKRIEFHAMGSRMLALVDSDTPAAEHAIALVPGWFEKWEQALSRFRMDSELSRLNGAAGRAVPVSAILWDVFQAARRMETYTAGLVRPTVLDALVKAGYDRSFDLLTSDGTIPNTSVSHSPRELEYTSSIELVESTRSLTLPGNVHLDFGGVAKGWAACKVVERLRSYGPTLMDAGGDIAVSGPNSEGQPWPIGVRDPLQPDLHFETLRLNQCGVATSGIDYHRWLQGGVWNHHLIDPGTGQPAETDLLSATIIATDAIHAEAAAKAVVIMGSRSGLDWLEADPALAGVLVLQSGEILYSQRMSSYLWRKS